MNPEAMTRKERDRANFLARVQAEQAARDATKPKRRNRKAVHETSYEGRAYAAGYAYASGY